MLIITSTWPQIINTDKWILFNLAPETSISRKISNILDINFREDLVPLNWGMTEFFGIYIIYLSWYFLQFFVYDKIFYEGCLNKELNLRAKQETWLTLPAPDEPDRMIEQGWGSLYSPWSTSAVIVRMIQTWNRWVCSRPCLLLPMHTVDQFQILVSTHSRAGGGSKGLFRGQLRSSKFSLLYSFLQQVYCRELDCQG